MKTSNFILAIPLLSALFFNIPAQVLDPVDWKFESRKVASDEIDLFFTATIDNKWHLYSQDIPQGGPIATSFTFTPSANYRLSGKPVEVSVPVMKHDPSFNMDLRMFSREAIFKQRIILTTSKDFVLEGSVEYMTCDDSRCLPPVDEDFSFDIKASSSASQTNAGGFPLKTAEKQLESGLNDTGILADNGAEGQQGQGSGISSAGSAEPGSKGSGIISQDTTSGSEQLSNPEKGEKRSIWVFFLISFAAGLAALLTPCVFPIIPMTVTFFMREGRRRIKAIMIGLVFGISIILIYTSIGFIVSLTSAGADVANIVSTHWIPNLIFFLLFVVFAASFLGMFELVLPGKWVNTSDRQADKGGYIGAFFMAFTLVLVSFSCTGPIVGALLVESAGGLALKPILGMFGFSLAFALPFTLLSIFPSWLSGLPKSGGWLNSIKVALGFIVLAFSFKFLSNIDQSYHLGLIGRGLYLSIWIVLFVMLGFYLLGKLKFAHDSDLPHISVARLFLSVASFAFAVYMVPGLFGAPLKGISSLLPPETEPSVQLRQDSASPGDQEGINRNISAGNCGPAKYSDFLQLPYGLQGYFDYDEGMECARQLNKPVLLDFKGHACGTCKVMEAKVWSDPAVLERLKDDFVIIALYVDDKTRIPANELAGSGSDKASKMTLGRKNLDFQISKFNTNTLPYYIVVDPDGNPLNQAIGYEPNASRYTSFLDDGLKNFRR